LGGAAGPSARPPRTATGRPAGAHGRSDRGAQSIDQATEAEIQAEQRQEQEFDATLTGQSPPPDAATP